MSYLGDIFKRLAGDPYFVGHLRRLQGKPALNAPELGALLRLDRIEGELAQTKYDIVHNTALRLSAIETQAFTVRKAFNAAAQPKGLFARSVEYALWALGTESSRNQLDTYETSIPEIDTVMESLKAARARLDAGASLRDVRDEVRAVHDGAFGVTLRLARAREGLSPQAQQGQQGQGDRDYPFGASNAPGRFGVP